MLVVIWSRLNWVLWLIDRFKQSSIKRVILVLTDYFEKSLIVRNEYQ